jgi:ABC-type phosphate transport system auxiliary subunit
LSEEESVDSGLIGKICSEDDAYEKLLTMAEKAIKTKTLTKGKKMEKLNESKERQEIINSPTLLRLYVEHDHPLPGDRSAIIPEQVLSELEELQQRLETLQEELHAWQGERQPRRLAEVGGQISHDDDNDKSEVEVREEN